MPIENERKYVLSSDVENKLHSCKRHAIRQAYLPSGQFSTMTYRLREIDNRRIFTVKNRNADGSATEVEMLLEEADFNVYWKNTEHALNKLRYIYYHDIWSIRYKWEIDVFKDSNDESYFWMAEIELPEGDLDPIEIPPIVRDHLIYKVPLTDGRFSSIKLSDIGYAKELLRRIEQGGI